MEKITITMTVNEWNIVMQALGNMPFSQVNSVINEIKVQAESQMQSVPAAAE